MVKRTFEEMFLSHMPLAFHKMESVTQGGHQCHSRRALGPQILKSFQTTCGTISVSGCSISLQIEREPKYHVLAFRIIHLRNSSEAKGTSLHWPNRPSSKVRCLMPKRGRPLRIHNTLPCLKTLTNARIRCKNLSQGLLAFKTSCRCCNPQS